MSAFDMSVDMWFDKKKKHLSKISSEDHEIDAFKGFLMCFILSSHLIGEAGANCGLYALVQVCISKNNGRVFTTQLQWELLTVGGTTLCDTLSSCRGTSEGDQWDVRVANEGATCFRTSAKHDVDYSWRNTCRDIHLCIYPSTPVGLLLHCGCYSPTSLLHQLAHHPGCHRGHLAGFGHDRISCSNCRRNLPGQQVQGEVPGTDQTSCTQHNSKTHTNKNGKFAGCNANTELSPTPTGQRMV